jgi:hypothetical protein
MAMEDIMDRFLAYMICAGLVLMLCSPVAAVEKRSKNAPKKPVATKAQPPANQGQHPPKKYDSFVDRNNNGIDDRQESAKTKTGQNVAPKPSVKDKPAASDSADKKAATKNTTKK